MLIVGAQGFAKEILSLVDNSQQSPWESIAFFDDINLDNDSIYKKFPILHTKEAVQQHFNIHGPHFVLGVGNPAVRVKLNQLMIDLGGEPISIISKQAIVGQFDTNIGKGTTIGDGVIITISVSVGVNCLINIASTIGHDCLIGDFVEICPNVSISGNCKIGAHSFIGTGAILLPGIELGPNTVVGAGTVVTKSFPSGVKLIGSPAKAV